MVNEFKSFDLTVSQKHAGKEHRYNCFLGHITKIKVNTLCWGVQGVVHSFNAAGKNPGSAYVEGRLATLKVLRTFV